MRPIWLTLLTLLAAAGSPVVAMDCLPPSPAAWIYQHESPGGWIGVRAAGDVNGDGFDDFLMDAPRETAPFQWEGRVFLFLGSATGPPATPDWVQAPAAPGGSLGARGPVGDLNGDGFDEILLSDGRLYMGSAVGPAPVPVETGWTGWVVAGDVNGDGYGDLAVDTAAGADIYHGSPLGIQG